MDSDKLKEALEKIADFSNWRKDINFEGKEVWMWIGTNSVLDVAMKALGKQLPINLEDEVGHD